jgi:hypothetical protein
MQYILCMQKLENPRPGSGNLPREPTHHLKDPEAVKIPLQITGPTTTHTSHSSLSLTHTPLPLTHSPGNIRSFILFCIIHFSIHLFPHFLRSKTVVSCEFWVIEKAYSVDFTTGGRKETCDLRTGSTEDKLKAHSNFYWELRGCWNWKSLKFLPLLLQRSRSTGIGLQHDSSSMYYTSIEMPKVRLKGALLKVKI